MIGVTLGTDLDHQPGSALVDLARKIERLGYESLWLTDVFGREPFSTAAWLLAKTERLRVGTSIANVYGRDADTAAQTRRTLGELAGGRFILGIGVSAKVINDLRGAASISPLAKMTAYLDRIHSAPTFSAEGTAPIYVAAHGPGLQQLARDKADGILTWVMPPAHTAAARARLGDRAAISAQLPVVLDADPAVARSIARLYLKTWLAVPAYQKAWLACGFGDADFTDGGSDRLVDTLVAWGDPRAIAARVQDYGKAGATRVIIQPLRMGDGSRPATVKGDTLVNGDWAALDMLAPLLME